jgi:general secretion pathway protein G
MGFRRTKFEQKEHSRAAQCGRATTRRVLHRSLASNFSGARGRAAGFTLIELMIVMFIMTILISIAVPSYRESVRRARESVLRQDLYDMRKLISEYTLDKQKAPQSLDDLVQAGYLKPVPKDPITNSQDWQTEQCEDDTTMSLNTQDQGGICDVHSSSTQIGSDGTAYNTW